MLVGSVLEIIDKEGWRKDFQINRALVHIGSAPNCDVVLPADRGGGIAPRHLQLLENTTTGVGYSVVNLSDSPIFIGEADKKTIVPLEIAEVSNGEHIIVGDFTLIYHAGVKQAKGTQAIGISLRLSQLVLHPEAPIEGVVTVSNQGEAEGVQFFLDVEGLDPDMYEIGAGPLLFPRAAKNVALKIYHPKDSRLRAGDQRFMVRATAPEAYPGESAIATQTIKVAPFYQHSLEIIEVPRRS